MTSDTVPDDAKIVAELPAWKTAEFLDMPGAGGAVLRALVCRLGADKWHWSISSLERESGALICSGLEKTLAAARETAGSELAKCLDDPTG
jgi:hypothetical protein